MPWGWRLLCAWPGLARLWLRGDFYALGLAVCYAILLNLALVSSLIWPAYLGGPFLLVTWPLLASVWLVNAWYSWRQIPTWLQVGHKFAHPVEPRFDTLFNQAQREYLKSRWTEARQILERRLRLRPRDVESRLLLASVLRRSGRFELAISELTRLEGMDEALPWSLELSRERRKLQLGPVAEQVEAKEQVEVVLNDSDSMVSSSVREVTGMARLETSAQELLHATDNGLVASDQIVAADGVSVAQKAEAEFGLAVAAAEGAGLAERSLPREGLQQQGPKEQDLNRGSEKQERETQQIQSPRRVA